MEILSNPKSNQLIIDTMGKKTLMKNPVQNILVIDDDEAVLFGHEEVFTDLGYNVKTAHTLRDALDLIDNHTFSIVVTDLNLSNSPEYEGFKIIEKVKKGGATNAILVVSAYSDDSVKKQAFNYGADYFLEKPVSSKALRLFFEKNGII